MSENSSKAIKDKLVEHFGGAAKDWKRLEKKKNQDGLWERAFEQTSTGLQVSVTEETNGELSFKTQVPKAAAPLVSLTTIERDPAKVSAAKKILKKTLLGDEGLTLEDLPQSLLKKSSDVAYANHFMVAIVSTDPSKKKYEIYVGSIALFERDGAHDDDTYIQIQHLLPRFVDDESGTNIYTCQEEPDVPANVRAPALPALETLRSLLKAGFHWKEDYQKACEEYASHRCGQTIQNTLSPANLFREEPPSGFPAPSI